METAAIALDQIIIMFLIAMTGIIAYKAKLISKETNTSLSNVVLTIVMPATIFMSYQIDFDAALLKGLGITILISALSFLAAIIISNLCIRKNPDSNIERLTIIYSNCSFIGIPLVNALIGADGVFYLAAYLTIFNLLLWTHGVVEMTGEVNAKMMIKAVASPSIVALAVGLACFVLNIRLHPNISRAVNYIASMNTPLAMLVAGATIAQADILKAVRSIRIYIITALKLVIVPALTVCLMLPFFKMGVDKNIVMTVIVATACPAGASGTMFALRFGKNAQYGSEMFTITTLFSAATIPLTMIFSEFMLNIIA